MPGSAIEGLQIFSLMGIAGLIELIAGGLLIIGLFSRSAAFIASGFTAAAYFIGHVAAKGMFLFPVMNGGEAAVLFRSEEHTSELQSLMRISYAVFCLKKKKLTQNHTLTIIIRYYRNNITRTKTRINTMSKS